MDSSAVRARAVAEVAEVAELGPEPADPRKHAMRAEERLGAIVRMSALADYARASYEVRRRPSESVR